MFSGRAEKAQPGSRHLQVLGFDAVEAVCVVAKFSRWEFEAVMQNSATPPSAGHANGV
jgi:hypothetical protein